MQNITFPFVCYECHNNWSLEKLVPSHFYEQLHHYNLQIQYLKLAKHIKELEKIECWVIGFGLRKFKRKTNRHNDRVHSTTFNSLIHYEVYEHMYPYMK